MAEWFLDQDGDVSGPYTWEELRFLSERQKIFPGHRVREGVTGDWTSAEKVPGLIRALRASVSAAGAEVVGVRPAEATAPKPCAPARSEVIRRAVAQVPPPLPREGGTKKRRWIALASVIAACLVLCILLALLASLFTDRGMGSAGTVAAMATTGSSFGSSSQQTESRGVGRGEDDDKAEPAAEPTTGVSAPESDHAESTEAASSPTKEPSADNPASPGDPDSAGDGDGSGGATAPAMPPPREAAVIMPLDDEESPSGDESSSSQGATGGTAEFFQIQGKGSKFVYVVDCSGSMAGSPFAKARDELLRSIEALKSGQRFFVIFFDQGEYPQFYPKSGDGMLRASASNKSRARKWISGFQPPGGGTDPRAALLRALALQPDAIYLLTDGEFDPGIADEVHARNRKGTAIHTISFMTRAAEFNLNRIAQENNGTYRFVP